MRQLGSVKPQTPSEVAKHRGLVCGIMGWPYSGKTSLEPTLSPKYTPTCLFDAAGGSHVLQDRGDDLQIYVPADWVELDGMLRDLETNPSPFKSIWTDVVTMVQEDSVDHHNIHNVTSADSRQRQIKFGDSNWDVVQYHRRLLTLAEQQGVNVFFVYWASRPSEVEGSDSRLKTRHIVLSPTVAMKVEGMLDILVNIEKSPHPKPYPPLMTLDNDQTLAVKVRLAPDNPLKHWKDKVTCTPTILSDMVDAFHGEHFAEYEKPA